MNRVYLILLSVFALCASTFCTPSSMRVGTFAINDYKSRGYSDTANLKYSIISADLFWKGSNITTYCGTTTNTRTINKTDSAVTYAAISQPANGKCDFFYFAGHGLFMTFVNPPPTPNTYNYGLCLGKPGTKWGNTYGGLFSDQYPNGANSSEYTRWMYLDCCSALRSTSWLTRWTPVFKGLQVALGYNSEGWQGYFSSYMLTDFWQEWTGKTTKGATYTPNSGIWTAHVHSVSKWIYGNGLGIAPACIEAYISGFPGPCYNTYTQANSYNYYPWTQLKYHWVYYGNPFYDGPGAP